MKLVLRFQFYTNEELTQLLLYRIRGLLPAFILVWINHGADEDWGPMCYPPLGSIRESSSVSKQRSRTPR
jgi:hypothetical protein